MSDLTRWPPYTVRADLPMYPVAIGQRESQYPHDVADRLALGQGCTSTPTRRHTFVNTHPADPTVRHYLADNRQVALATTVCQGCGRWVHFAA